MTTVTKNKRKSRNSLASAVVAGCDISSMFRPPRRMKISDAVRKYMRVPRDAGNSVAWESTLTPYVVEAMNCLSSRSYDAVVFVAPARTGKTLGLIDGWISYNIVCDPSDMLVVQMTQDKAQEHSKRRLAKMFRHSPAIARRLSPHRNDNNVHDKTFRDGSFLKIGWPSINVFSSSDFKCVALTDYDRFPEDVDGEGDAFSLASKRTTTFMSLGMTLVESSPGREITDTRWKPSSPHEAPPTTGILSLYNRGDRRRWYWPCPHCGEYFQLSMANMTGYRHIADPMEASEAARIQCPHCHKLTEATIADLVYDVLISNQKLSSDNVALFDKTKHANVLEKTVMDVASLDKARQLMRMQKEGDRHLNIRPAFVLVPTAMESVSNQVIKSVSVKGADINAGIINPVKDFATVIAEPRLDDASQSTFYLTAAKGSDTVEVAYPR